MADEIMVQALRPGMLPDYQHFFDHDAFVDNADWASCYCNFYFADHKVKDWGERTGEENRTAVSERIGAGQMRGYLAYRDGKTVGWCNAAPKLSLPNVRNNKDLKTDDIDRVGAIVCFVVAQPVRRQGIAWRLLDAACEGFKRDGLEWAEAYPRINVNSDAGNYHGPLAMYLNAGFETFREFERFVVVRKKLG